MQKPNVGDNASRRRIAGAARTFGTLLAVVIVSALSISAPARAERSSGKQLVSGTTTPPAPFRVVLEPVLTAEQPVGLVTRLNDDSIYVIEKPGRIRAFAGPERTSRVVLDIASRVDSVNERGLLGLAFHPTRRDVMYIDYTDRRGNVIVSEVPFDGTSADMTRERKLLDIAKPFNEHNAGTLLVDDRGLLYVAIGDGGGANDKFNHAQRLDSLLGKVLRIDPTPSGDKPYSIPTTNPFVKSGLGATATRRPEIFAFGLRNPWGISVDAATGSMWVPDVGQAAAEEINRVPLTASGWNFGWKLREGRVGTKVRGAVEPVFDYPHKDGRCAVVGGRVYRGAAISPLVGWYVIR